MVGPEGLPRQSVNCCFFMGCSMGKRVLVICPEDIWEEDFIREVIPLAKSQWHWVYINRDKPVVRQPLKLAEIIKALFSCRYGVLVVSSNHLSAVSAHFFISIMRPKVLVHLSDEWGSKFGFSHLHRRVGLVVRQHHHAVYSEPETVVCMPLGYMKGMFKGQSSVSLSRPPVIRDRSRVWSFVGDVDRPERQEALSCFSAWVNGEMTNSASPAEMNEIYSDTIFVPSPRGHVRLDCFRHYEASIAGAIPVIVGSKTEIAETFKFEREAPWIYARNWAEAIELCEKELADFSLLQARQDNILAWWEKRVSDIRTKVDNALKE